jgi:glycosyltransferase involved in cell wall biosynthesis
VGTSDDNPLVTIVIPTYNYAKYLGKALGSCLRQSYGRLEIIVIDDGSTDNTEEVVRSFEDGRISYYRQENQGVSAARNRGLSLARGDFITFLDADDYLTDDSIEQRLGIMLTDGDIQFVIGTAYSQDDHGTRVLRHRFSLRDTISESLCEELLMRRMPFQTGGILVRTSRARKFEFPVELTNGEDLVYFSKIFFRTRGRFLSKPVAVTWSHADSLRHHIKDLKEQGTGLVGAIFDDPYFEGRLDHLRRAFTAYRCLELFRRFSRSGDTKLARSYYKKAVSTQPSRLLKVDYLVKFLRTYLQS